MILFYTAISFGVVFGIAHGIFVHKLGNYLKMKHPSIWNEIVPKKFLGFSNKDINSRNYFKEIEFVFSSDNLGDESVSTMKFKIKLFLFAAVCSWAGVFLSFILI